MELQNTLAANINSASDKAALDAACKRLLSNKIILAWIMKSCLNEYQNCSIEEISNNYIEGTPQIAAVAVNPDETHSVHKESSTGESIIGINTEDVTMTEGTITYDIRFFAVAPVSGELIRLIINIEAQNDYYPGYPLIKRGLYYCSRMISAQYGTEFTGSHYEQIKKVYSIWICINPPAKRKNSITRYMIQEECLIGNGTESVDNYDLLSAIMICLGDPNDKDPNGILKLLEVLLSSSIEVKKKKEILKHNFNIEMTKTMEREVSLMCNLSKGIEEKGIAIGFKRGLEQGMERGMEQGMEQGTIDALLSSLRNLMENTGWSLEQSMSVLNVPENLRSELIDQLKQPK